MTSAGSDAPPNDRITLRFMMSPQEVASSGTTVAAGSVLEWIDKAGYACAVGWSSTYCVTAYVGNVHFTRPIPRGSLIRVQARIIHTGRTSMQVLVTVDATDVRERAYEGRADCILVFVAVDASGSPVPVPQWAPSGPEDEELGRRALERVPARQAIKAAMNAQRYSSEGTAPRTVFRFLAAPKDANYGGNAHGGTVMRWIDEVAYACAAGWSSERAVGVYSGGIHFTRPIRIGHLVELEARMIHTGRRSMHLAVHVRSAPPDRPSELALTTQCMSIFVDLGADGRARPVASLHLVTDEDHRLQRHARELIEMRSRMAPISPELGFSTKQ